MNGAPINPVLSGLVNAFSLANMIHRQRSEDQQLALEQQRMADNEAMQKSQEERQNADLAMRLNAVGARPMTPSDELEANTGTAVNFGPHGLPSLAPSDLQSRLVKAGGQQWVLPSQDDKNALADQENQREIARSTAKIKAEGQAKTDAAISSSKSQLAALGVALKDEYADKLGLPRGTRVMPGDVDNYARTVAAINANEAKEDDDVRAAVPMYGERGSGVAVIHKDGTVKWNPVAIGPRASTGSANQDRLAEQWATAKLNEETASHYATGFDSLNEAEAALKKDSATDPYVKKNYVSILAQLRKTAPPKQTGANQMTADQLVQALRGGGQSATPRPAPSAAPQQAPKKSKGTVNGDQIRAYATRKGIAYAAAQKEFEASGYTVGAR